MLDQANRAAAVTEFRVADGRGVGLHERHAGEVRELVRGLRDELEFAHLGVDLLLDAVDERVGNEAAQDAVQLAHALRRERLVNGLETVLIIKNLVRRERRGAAQNHLDLGDFARGKIGRAHV